MQHLISARPLLILLLTLAAHPTLAQEPPANTFTDNIDVRVVNLDVVVTDGRGERVAGLLRSPRTPTSPLAPVSGSLPSPPTVVSSPTAR